MIEKCIYKIKKWILDFRFKMLLKKLDKQLEKLKGGNKNGKM